MSEAMKSSTCLPKMAARQRGSSSRISSLPSRLRPLLGLGRDVRRLRLLLRVDLLFVLRDLVLCGLLSQREAGDVVGQRHHLLVVLLLVLDSELGGVGLACGDD